MVRDNRRLLLHFISTNSRNSFVSLVASTSNRRPLLVGSFRSSIRYNISYGDNRSYNRSDPSISRPRHCLRRPPVGLRWA